MLNAKDQNGKLHSRLMQASQIEDSRDHFQKPPMMQGMRYMGLKVNANKLRDSDKSANLSEDPSEIAALYGLNKRCAKDSSVRRFCPSKLRSSQDYNIIRNSSDFRGMNSVDLTQPPIDGTVLQTVYFMCQSSNKSILQLLKHYNSSLECSDLAQRFILFIESLTDNLNKNNGLDYKFENQMLIVDIQLNQTTSNKLFFAATSKQILNLVSHNVIVIKYTQKKNTVTKQVDEVYKAFVKHSRQVLYKVQVTMMHNCLYSKLINQNNRMLTIGKDSGENVTYFYSFNGKDEITTKDNVMSLKNYKQYDNVMVKALYKTQTTQSSGLDISSLKKQQLRLSLLETSINVNEIENVSTPLQIDFVKQTNVVAEPYEIRVHFNYTPSDSTMYLILNEDANGEFMYSDVQMQLTATKHYDKIEFAFLGTDIGMQASLLLQDDSHHYIIPLTSQPVQPSKSLLKQIDQIQAKKTSINCNLIGLKHEFNKITLQQHKSGTLFMSDATTKQQIELKPLQFTVLHPCVLFYSPQEHPTTLRSQFWYDYLISFQQYIEFEPNQFLNVEFQKRLENKHRIQLNPDAQQYLFLVCGKHLNILYFQTQKDRDTAYQMLLFQNKQLNLTYPVDSERKQQISEEMNNNTYADHVFPVFKDQMFSVQKQKTELGDGFTLSFLKKCRIYVLVVLQEKVIHYQEYKQNQLITLGPAYTHCGVEVHAFAPSDFQSEVICDCYMFKHEKLIKRKIQNLHMEQIVIENVEILLENQQHCVGSVVLLESGTFHIVSPLVNFVSNRTRSDIEWMFKATILIHFEQNYYQIRIPEDFFPYLIEFFEV